MFIKISGLHARLMCNLFVDEIYLSNKYISHDKAWKGNILMQHRNTTKLIVPKLFPCNVRTVAKYQISKNEMESHERALVFIQSVSGSGSGFPPSEDSRPCNAVNSEREGSHPEVAVMGFAHLLHTFEAFGHVSPELIVHLLFIPQESLNVLQFMHHQFSSMRLR